MKRYGFIYKTTNNINGKIYIGQKKYTRINSIKNPVPSYIGSGTHLINAVDMYGKENFSREILCWCTNKQALDDCEIFFIKHFDATNQEIGYNVSSGGQLHMPDIIVGLSGPDNPNYGNKWTDEMKERQRKILEYRDYTGSNNPNCGNKWSAEQRKRASDRVKSSGQVKGKNNPRAVAVKCLEDDIVYGTMSDVAKKHNLSLSCVYNRITKGRKIDNKTYIRIDNNSPL